MDFSREMLKVGEDAAKEYPFKTTPIEKDVETIYFNESTFDTFISLCAYQELVNVLSKFEKGFELEGEILMMEHVISTIKALALL